MTGLDTTLPEITLAPEGIALAVIAGFFGGLLLVSRIGRWLHEVITLTRACTSSFKRGPVGAWLSIVFLHSAPWLLVCVLTSGYYFVKFGGEKWLPYVAGGVCFAIAVVVAVAAVSRTSAKSAQEGSAPLTPEDMRVVRKRTLWVTTLYWGGAMSIGMLYGFWDGVGHSLGFAIFVIAASMAGGYLFALFIWAWQESAIQAREWRRKRSQQQSIANQHTPTP